MSDNIYICKHCGKSFNTKQALGGHVVSHSQEKIKNILQKKENKISEYFKNPKLCLHCQKPIDYEKRENTFCGSSCGASNSNKRKNTRSEESKQKTGITLKELKPILYPPRTKIKFCQCEICNKHFVWNNIKKGSLRFCSKECSKSRIGLKKTIIHYPKTNIKFCQCEICNKHFVWNNIKKGSLRFCSKECLYSHFSKRMIIVYNDDNLKKRYGRGKKSYMEQSFEDWLNTFSLSFQMEKHFYNYELKKNYYVDFYFPQFNLVIELDGTQHLKTIDKDQIRDEFLTRVHNLNVVRISHKEYIKKLKFDEICKLLHIT